MVTQEGNILHQGVVHTNPSAFLRSCGAGKEMSGWKFVYCNGRRLGEIRNEFDGKAPAARNEFSAPVTPVRSVAADAPSSSGGGGRGAGVRVSVGGGKGWGSRRASSGGGGVVAAGGGRGGGGAAAKAKVEGSSPGHVNFPLSTPPSVQSPGSGPKP